MKELYELREMLEKELKEHGNKGELSAGSLEIIDKLTHAIKNLDKIIDCDENGYSGDYSGRSYHYHDGSYEGAYNNGSYGRGRGSNARRDSMGRYSSDRGYSRASDMAEGLRRLMDDAPNEQVRKDIQRIVDKVEQM